MSTTTIRLTEELKLRVASAADRAGSTAHSFILQAIAEKIEKEELRSTFDEAAEERYANVIASGDTISWTDMRRYLEERVAGRKPSRPVAGKLVR